MSLKAGGVGINLTAASNAFVLVCIRLRFQVKTVTFRILLVTCISVILSICTHTTEVVYHRYSICHCPMAVTTPFTHLYACDEIITVL